MTEESSVEHLPVVMTTNNVTDDVTAATRVTSSPRGIEFYFQCAVVVIGVVGTAANGLILYAMVVSKQHKKQMLIFNQNVLDVVSCLFLVITYALTLRKIHLTGSGGYWLCMWILSDNIIWCVVIASKTSMVEIAVERYLRVVYPTWSKAKLRDWVLYAAIAFAWISGFVHMMAVTFKTSAVIDGACYAYVVWESRVAQVAYAILMITLFRFTILLVLIFCYWRIVVVIRRQARVMAGHSNYSGPGPSAYQIQSNQIQTNLIKTMIIVSVFYSVSDFPVNVYYIILSIHPELSLTLLDWGYYASVFFSYLYFCANPFIYATKFEPVKRVVLKMIPCMKNAVQPIGSIDIANTPRVAASSAAQPPVAD